jgi:hypothetical protein
MTSTDLRDFPIHHDDDDDDDEVSPDSGKVHGGKFEFSDGDKKKLNSTVETSNRKIQQCRLHFSVHFINFLFRK